MLALPRSRNLLTYVPTHPFPCESPAPEKALTSVDVSDNAFGAKGLDACAALLEGQTKLTSLKVHRRDFIWRERGGVLLLGEYLT